MSGYKNVYAYVFVVLAQRGGGIKQWEEGEDPQCGPGESGGPVMFESRGLQHRGGADEQAKNNEGEVIIPVRKSSNATCFQTN